MKTEHIRENALSFKEHVMKEQHDELLCSYRDGANSLQTKGGDHSRGALSRKSVFAKVFIQYRKRKT